MTNDTDRSPETAATGPRLPGGNPAQRIAEMIRVDHAGEHGAVSIYEGQLAVFGKRHHKAHVARTIRKMADQEAGHLKAFDEMILARGVRPTLLSPIWDVAGFALGAATALLGEQAAMACTVAVEEVIDEHYASQAERLAASGEDEPLRETVEAFRRDELEHRDTALAAGATSVPGYAALSTVIKGGCRLAIRLSEKI